MFGMIPFVLVGLACFVLATAETYIPLEGCAVDEGEDLGGPYKGCDVACCQKKCDANPKCNSISIFGVGKKCNLKSACLTADAPIKINKYTTWYKACDGNELDLSRDPRFQSEINVDATASVDEILEQMHLYCTKELYSDKWKSKSGALMGSKTVKGDMEDPKSTHCSNADWQASIDKLALTNETYRSLFTYEDNDPCKAEKMYHYIYAGIGSWVSNLANVMYTHSIGKGGRTLAFRDQKDKPATRWEKLLGHEIPLCWGYTEKSTPFVRPDTIGSLKSKNVCDYAAAKGFFVHQLWMTMLNGPYGADVAKGLDENLALIKKAAIGDLPAGNYNGAYIGLHLRHKWEFKLQPPKLVDVATLIRTAAAQLNPVEHTEVAHADAECFADDTERAEVWGPAQTVIFCATDEVQTCEVLQSMLGSQFFVHAIPNLKIVTGATHGVLSYLLDVALLANSAVFIGSGSSNLSRMVNAIRGPKKLSLSMDIDFNTVHF